MTFLLTKPAKHDASKKKKIGAKNGKKNKLKRWMCPACTHYTILLMEAVQTLLTREIFA